MLVFKQDFLAVHREGAFTPEPEYRARCVPYQLESIRDCTGKLPLRLQDHGQIVSFRNIWIRELDDD